VLWAATSVYLYRSPLRLPSPIALLMVLSGAIALVGGCFGAAYLLYVALYSRLWQHALGGLCATLANFCYVWWYSEAIFHQ